MSEEADLASIGGERTGLTRVQGAAEGRPWKVKAYRRHGPFARRLHREVLPAGVEPETRMLDLLDDVAARD